MKQGAMIVIDGGNGAGKSTILKAVAEYLEHIGIEAKFTREPGGTPIAESIRDLLLAKGDEPMSNTSELLLFAAARAQHLQSFIIPSIESGQVVICDRFDAAMFAFQHYSRGLDYDLVHSINEIATSGFKPDMTIILDIDVKLGIERVKGRGQGLDRMDAQSFEFLERARQGYLDQARKAPERFHVVDASQSLPVVQANVIAEIAYVLKKKEKGSINQSMVA